MFKKVLSTLLVAVMLFTITACGTSDKGNDNSSADAGKVETKADKGLEVMGQNMKYDPNHLVNGGKPVKVDFWAWSFIDMFQDLVDQYQKIHPSVTINIIETPWSDYWTKLPLALGSNNGPALFAIHNSYHDNLINYMAPYDIPLKELQADFLNVDSHLIDNKIYYIDFAMMTSNIYYNKDLWKAAGLTDADLPTTWGELAEVAKKLTIKDGDTFKQAGFNFNGTFNQMILGLNYQYGQNLFNEDGTANINNDAMNKIIKTFVDMYEVDGVGSPDFGTDCGESFGQGQSAMVAMWGWYHENLKNTYPDINFGVIETPKFDDVDDVYAYNRYNGESSFGINKNISDEQMEVAQDFVKFSLANDDFLMDYSVQASCFPTKLSLADREEVKNHQVLSALAPNIDKYIWPGAMPSTLEDNLKIAGENIFYNNMGISDALKEAEASINADLKEVSFTPVEDMYKYAK